MRRLERHQPVWVLGNSLPTAVIAAVVFAVSCCMSLVALIVTPTGWGWLALTLTALAMVVAVASGVWHAMFVKRRSDTASNLTYVPPRW